MIDEQGILERLEREHPHLAHLSPVLQTAVDTVCACHEQGGKILLCGNGGSAADCAHIVGELVKGFLRRRPMPEAQARLQSVLRDSELGVLDRLQGGICAIDLCNASSLLTAVANDQSAELIFAQPVYAMGRPGDILIGLSTSGNSANVVRAMQVAQAQEMMVIGFRGRAAGAMDPYCDLILDAPASETYAIQECHLPLYHGLCAMVEARLFPNPD